jgi:hypothetical protein
VSARTLPLICVALGIATLIAFLALGSQPEVRAVYQPEEVSAAVSAFQRAETLMDVALVFGAPPQEARVAAMDALNTLDLYAFIPAYVLFLIAAAIMVGGVQNRWTQVAIFFAVLGGLFDAIETWKQLQLTADFENVESHLPIAPWHWLKYGALALNGVAVASICFAASKPRYILGVIALLSFPMTVLAYMGLTQTRAFALALGIYWVALLVFAAIEAVRGRGSPAPVQSPP